MVYIRGKRVKGKEYLYLVRSAWDSERKTSRQTIVKYLGNAAKVTPEDIPLEYRGLKEVARFLALRKQTGRDHGGVAAELTESLYRSLTEGDLKGSLAVYDESVSLLGTAGSFFDMVLRPVLYDIGERWAQGRMDIATEHVASNVAQALVRIVLDRNSRRPGKTKVVLCVPPGEEHRMGCDVMETYLRGCGFVVYNLGSPLPSSEVVSFVEQNRPDVVMISVSMDESLQSAKRLVDKITSRRQIPVMVGGYAFRNGSGRMGKYAIPEQSLRELPRSIRRVIREQSRRSTSIRGKYRD